MAREIYTEFDQLYMDRWKVITDFLKSNMEALRGWKIPLPHQLPFRLLADKLEVILRDEFGVVSPDVPPGVKKGRTTSKRSKKLEFSNTK